MRKFIVCAALVLAGCGHETVNQYDVETISVTRRVDTKSLTASPTTPRRIARVVIDFDDGTSAEAKEK